MTSLLDRRAQPDNFLDALADLAARVERLERYPMLGSLVPDAGGWDLGAATGNWRDIYLAQYLKAAQFWGVVGIYLALPGLRGFWPMSTVNESGNAYDLSGQGRTLTYTGNPTYNYDGFAPYVDLDGTGDYLTRGDEAGLDITGTEATVAAAVNGLTMGGWFWVDAFTVGQNYGFMGKSNTSGDQRGYLLYIGESGVYAGTVSNSGTVATTVTIAGSAIVTGGWEFLTMRFTPSTELALFVGDLKYTNTTSVPASIYGSSEDFQIGAFNAGTYNLDGRASMCFLSDMLLSDDIILALYGNTRALFDI